jgi:hypothetical protein
MTKILTFLTTVLCCILSATAFSPNVNNPNHATSTSSLPAVEEMASTAMQHGSDMIHHGVVGPFSRILEGHHPAQFDSDGIMMTEHVDHHNMKGFVPPSPMQEAALELAVIPTVASEAAINDIKHRRHPLPVYYMD